MLVLMLNYPVPTRARYFWYYLGNTKDSVIDPLYLFSLPSR